LQHTWDRLRVWLSNEYPELGDTLNYGILPQDLAQVEMTFGFALPGPVRESYLCVDGQEPESSAGCSEGLFFGLTLLPLEDVFDEWRFWREVDGDPNTGANAKLGIDMNPDEGGAVGQVIVFGRDFDTKVVMWRGDGPGGWAKWLAAFVDDLESGDGYELGGGADSEGSEDSVGYENYFFDGVGRGLGDGGGDIGGGGMRLTGEYRGWNVLEAWADRSVRRWQESGLVPEQPPSPPSKGKAREKFPPEGLNISTAGAEVPIPVLAISPQDEPELASILTPLGNVTDRDHSAPRQSLPTIAVTKPPVPRPVDLPTQDDILITVDTDHRVIHDDLEAGGNIAMREIEAPGGKTPVTSPRSPESVDPLSSLPTTSSSKANIPNPNPIAPPSINIVPDLLQEVTPALIAHPILPSTPTSPITPKPEVAEVTVPAPLEQDSPVLVSNEDAFEQPLEATIRLVGSGGVSEPSESSTSDGVLVSEPESEAPVPEASTPDISASTETITKKGNKHEKKSSISANLKKLGGIGNGKRKKESVSSIKEVI